MGIRNIHLARSVQQGIIIALGALPIFFLPTTQNFYDTNKWLLIAVAALFTVMYWAGSLLQYRTPAHVRIPLGALGFGALTVASLIGLFTSSTNKIEALLSPLGPVTLIALTVLILFVSAAEKPGKMLLKWVLYGATGLLGLIAIYQSMGIGKLMFPVSFLTDPLWTPTGTSATTVALFFIVLSLLVPEIIAFKKRQEHTGLAVLIIICIVATLGTGITIIQFIPKMGTMLPLNIGFTVASQIFKNPASVAFGTGVENFVTAFTRARPASLNMTQLAGIAFTTNADFFLHVLTVYGLTGLVGGILFAMSLFWGINKGWFLVTKLICLASLLLIPPTITLLAVIAMVLVLTPNSTPVSKPIAIAPWIRISTGFLFMLIVAIAVYFLIRAYTAEFYFFRSLRASQTNDGTKTYNLQILAIETNTFISLYHSAYSQTSLSLANSIVNAMDQSPSPDKDRELVGQLIQQAVKEAKKSVALNPSSVVAWENLGLTYQSIIPVATESAGWALAAYADAAKLDPSNPTLFLNIGSVFVNQKDYDNAIAAFNRSIQLDPSHANAYYNLANVYTLKGDMVNAQAAYTNTLNFVEPESTDYYKVKNQLDTIQRGITPNSVEPKPATESSVLLLP